MTVQTMSSQQSLGGPVAPSVGSFDTVVKHPGGTPKERSDDVEVMSSDSSSSSSSDE